MAQGAPDLALTQLLVETVVVVGFVIGLGRLSTNFPQVGYVWRSVRMVVSVGLGGAVAIGLAAAASSPSGTAPVAEFVERAADTGGGNNVVNVILTDIRALDTFARSSWWLPSQSASSRSPAPAEQMTPIPATPMRTGSTPTGHAPTPPR